MESVFVKRQISWTDAEIFATKLASKLQNISKIDAIVSVGRGGLVLARLMSERLDVKDIVYAEIHAYNGEKCGTFEFDNLNEVSKRIRDKSVLVIDDCITTGTTLGSFNALMKTVASHIYYAVMYKNEKMSTSAFIEPIEYHETYDGDKYWLVFPWERTMIGEDDMFSEKFMPLNMKTTFFEANEIVGIDKDDNTIINKCCIDISHITSFYESTERKNSVLVRVGKLEYELNMPYDEFKAILTKILSNN